MSKVFTQTVSINDCGYCIQWDGYYFYNDNNYIYVGALNTYDDGPYLGILCFNNLNSTIKTWQGKIIKKITFTFENSNTTFMRALNFYKCSQESGLVIRTGEKGQSYRGTYFGDKLSGITSDTNTVSVTFSKDNYSTQFNNMVSYLQGGAENFIIYDEDGDDPNDNPRLTSLISITISIEYDEGLVYYGVNGEWQPCLVYYGVNGSWQQVIPYYGVNGSWQQLGGG